jgi:hypothetical protein
MLQNNEKLRDTPDYLNNIGGKVATATTKS